MRAVGATVLMLGALVGCASGPPAATRASGVEPVADPRWDAGDFEILTWIGDDPDFNQDRALEASGLTASPRFFYVVAEKYATVLQIDPADGLSMIAVPLDVPHGAEMEGVTWADGTLYICDEAHAAVYAAAIDEDAVASGTAPGSIAIRELPVRGLAIEGGKVGYEGVAVDAARGKLYLLLERSGDESSGCKAMVFPLYLAAEELRADTPPIVIPLASCDWRVAGLFLWQDRLLAIQSLYPGEEYRILEIDPAAGEHRLLLDITEMGRSLRSKGYGNNLEGIAVGPDGALYLVGDNADIKQALSERPPATDERTVFLRIAKAD